MFEPFSHLSPLVILVACVAAAWVILRWGPIIFIGYAIWHFALGDWTATGLALAFACFLQFLKAPIALYNALTARGG